MKELLGIRLSASSLAVFSLTTLSAMEAFAVTGEVPPGLGELIVGVAEVSSSRETNLFAYGKHINRDPRNIHPAKHVAMNIFNVTRTYTYSVAQFGFGSQVAPANPPASINFAPSDDSTTPLGQDPSPSTQSGTLAPPLCQFQQLKR